MVDTRKQNYPASSQFILDTVGGGGGEVTHTKRTLHRFQLTVEVTPVELHPLLFPTKMQTKKITKLFMTN